MNDDLAKSAWEFLRQRWEIILFALLACRVLLALWRNEDLEGYWGYLKIALVIVGLLFFSGWMLGIHALGSCFGGVLGGCLLAVPGLWFLAKMCDRAFNDMLGGLLFDLVFSEGPFAEKIRTVRKIPNLTLLRHWREHGLVRKASHAARRALKNDSRTFPLWLFAMETAALYCDDLREAERLARRLHRCDNITEDQKVFAVQELKGWAAAQGVNVDLTRFTCRRSPLRQGKELREADHLREAGCFREAESKLLHLRRQDSDDFAAALLLLRIYTQDLRRRDKAEDLLRQLSKQPYASEAFLEFARRSLDEWAGMPVAAKPRKRTWWQRGTGTGVIVPEKFVIAGPPAQPASDAPGGSPVRSKQDGFGTRF
ncbi:MAG: hypothetical protein ACLQVW_09805 [Limisphaerales bacterium]